MTIQPAPPEGLPEFLDPIRCLGEGGMGSVWSVRDTRSGRLGALKAIRSSLLTESAILRRFEREMRTIAQLNHPYIVQILDVGRLHTGAPYMLMEQIDGVPLIDLPLQGRTLGELIRLFDRILAALGYAHARRIIHRDLKPDNVLVYTDELGELIPKLMDFGLAMVAVRGQLATRLTADGMVVGTPAYMAAEQACDEHHKICPATDLYAFGCMLYELMCGTPPFVAASPMALLLAHAMKPPRPFVPLSTVPQAELLEPLVMRLLEKDPLNRFEFAADVRAELRESGLLESDADVDAEQIGSYGDTMLGVSIPDELRPVGESKREPVEGAGRVSVKSSRSALGRAVDTQILISVLNLREPPFVGRSEPRNLLKRYLEDVRRAGQAGICLVHGTTGIGKSRLVQWLCEDAETRGAARYLRATIGTGSSISLAVLNAVIERLRLRGLSQNQSEQAMLRFFGTSDLADWRVAGFLSLVSKREDMSSSAMGSTMGRIDLLVYAALQQLAVGRPLVLWLDDTHTVSPVQIGKLVRFFAGRQKTDPAPVLVVIVDRTEGDAPSDLEMTIGKIDSAWLRPGIHLDPLDGTEMLALTRDGLQLAPKLAAHVVKLADGLPLLAVALARQWHAAGLLDSTAAGYDAIQELHTLPVPAEVRAVLMSQLELAFGGLDHELWGPLADLAAVLGRTFTLEQLQAGLPSIPKRVATLSPAAFLEQALAEGVIRSTAQDGIYEFSSGLMREGLLLNLSPERRTDLHRAASVAKAADAIGQPGRYVEVARHMLAGRLFAEAYEAFVSAAREAIAHGRQDDAMQLLDSAQEALASEEGVSGPWDTRVAAVWELELVVAVRTGNLADARERQQWLSHAATRIGDPLWQARAMIADGVVLRAEGRDADAQRRLQEAGRVARAASDAPPQERARIVARTLLELVDLSVEDLEEAVRMAREGGDPQLAARGLVALGCRLVESDQLEMGRNTLAEALAASRSASDLRLEAAALSGLARVAELRGELLDAERMIYEASRGYEAMGDFEQVAALHQQLAELARRQGREGDAKAHERWLALVGSSH